MGWPTRRWKTRSTTARHCAASWAPTCRANPVPDATMLLKFRHLLQDNDLARALFDEISSYLDETADARGHFFGDLINLRRK